jgi:hypothetical protein
MSLINSKLLKIITSFLFHLINKYHQKILSSNSNDIYIIFLKYIQSKYNISKDKIEKVYNDMFIDILSHFNYYDPFNVSFNDFIFTCIRNVNGNADKDHIYNSIKKTIFLLLPISSIIKSEKSNIFNYSFDTKELQTKPTFTIDPLETPKIEYLDLNDFHIHKLIVHESNDKEVKINISKKKWEQDFFNTLKKTSN